MADTMSVGLEDHAELGSYLRAYHGWDALGEFSACTFLSRPVEG